MSSAADISPLLPSPSPVFTKLMHKFINNHLILMFKPRKYMCIFIVSNGDINVYSNSNHMHIQIFASGENKETVVITTASNVTYNGSNAGWDAIYLFFKAATGDKLCSLSYEREQIWLHHTDGQILKCQTGKFIKKTAIT